VATAQVTAQEAMGHCRRVMYCRAHRHPDTCPAARTCAEAQLLLTFLLHELVELRVCLFERPQLLLVPCNLEPEIVCVLIVLLLFFRIAIAVLLCLLVATAEIIVLLLFLL
jgi:hypothetical protein